MFEVLNVVIDSLKRAAKLNIALNFVFGNEEDGKCNFFHSHENNALLDRSQLVAKTEKWEKIKSLLNIIDVIESCKKTNRRCMFDRLTNVAFCLLHAEKQICVLKKLFCQNPLSKAIGNGNIKSSNNNK